MGTRERECALSVILRGLWDLREGVCALSVILRGLWGTQERECALSVILRGLWGPERGSVCSLCNTEEFMGPE